MYNRFVGTVFFAAVLLARQGYSQCFNNTDCSGTEVTANDERDCCVGTDDGRSYQLGTSCTPCIVHGFERTAYCVIERGRSGSAGDEGKLEIIFRPNVKGMQVNVTLPGEISVDDRSTAEGGTDYDTIPPKRLRNNRATIPLITRNDDVALEHNDNVIMIYNPGVPGFIPTIEATETGVYIRNTTTVTIEDNDLLRINFDLREYGFTEGSPNYPEIRLQFTQIQNPFDITLTPVEISTIEGVGNFSHFIDYEDSATDGARATAGDDFENASVTIRVYPDDEVPFQVGRHINVTDEEIVEVDQFFALVAVIGQNVPEGTSCFQDKASGQTECFGRVGATQIKIFNDDKMVVGFTDRFQTISESKIPDQDEEQFDITITISSKRVSEQEYRMQFSLQPGLTNATVVPLISSTADFDVKFGAVESDLHPGSMGVIITATGKDDLRPEDKECFTVLIEPIDTTLRETFSCISDSDITSTENSYFCLHTVCIVDDDDPFVVALVETTYTVFESNESVEVCAHVTDPLEILDETVVVFIIDDSSSVINTCNGRDATPDMPDPIGRYLMPARTDFAQQTEFYNQIDDTTITSAMMRVCYNQPIYNDERLEPIEYFGVTLGVFESSSATNVDPMYDLATICIVDDDVAVVGLEMTVYSVSEGDGNVEVCAVVRSPNIDCPIEFPFAVNLTTKDGSAISPMDYGALSTTLIFDTCETRECTIITIANDDIPEGTESFNVTLEGTPGLDERITLDPVDGEIQIDEAVVGLEETFYQTAEGVGTVEVCAVVYSPNGNLACPIDFAFSVELLTGDGVAVSTMDYGSITTTLPFGRCDTRSCVNVSITDDEVLENPESFSVSLQRNGLDSRITLEPTQGEIEIIDNDDAVIGLERTLYSIREGSAPTVQVCIIVYEPTGDCPIAFPFSVMFSTSDGTAEVNNDYLDADRTQDFEACDTRRCISVPIVDDSIGEPDEQVSISLGDPSHSRIIASPREGLINITDTIIHVVFVNDTVTGDPLMTVPVATLPDTSTLCYEVHGEADKFFNLISDNCVSVNAHYAKAGINNPNITLNVIDAVGIRAVSSNGSCVNIRVGLEGCTASIDGVDLSGMYRENGIVVRKYSSRVRITVPNCDDTDLVMWIFCTRGGTEDPYTWEYFSFNFLRFVVMRGLNLREESHGLLGQFWNIEIVVEEHTDLFNGASRSDDYTVTVHPNDPNDSKRKRSFVALESSVTWEFEKKPCLYVGNSQAGPLGEDVAPNESVIQGSYKDYMVDSMFSPNFIFAHIDQDNCMAK